MGDIGDFKFIREEVKLHDKSTIYLPWQCLRDGANALILLGFLDGNVEFTPLEDRIGIVEIII